MDISDPRVDPRLVPDNSRAFVIAEHQDEYRNLPSICTPAVIVDGQMITPPQVITRWTPTDEERLAILRGEDIYVTLLSAGMINPFFVTVGPVNWRTR